MYKLDKTEIKVGTLPLRHK